MEDFGDYLGSVMLMSGSLLIAGDFNFHMDSPVDSDAKQFKEFLCSLDLKQHVCHPTHRCGHMLDFILSRSIDNLVRQVAVGDLLSDHMVLHCELNVSRPSLTEKEISFRKIKDIDIERFKLDLMSTDIVSNPKDTACELAIQYNQTLSSLLDEHAPLQKKILLERPLCSLSSSDIKPAKARRRA